MKRIRNWLRRTFEFIAIEFVGRALYFTGVLFLIGFVRQRVGRRRLLVPMYHRIAAPDVSPSDCLLPVQYGVPLRLFEQQLRIFRWFGPLLTLDEGFRQLHDAQCPLRSTVAITFDDGYCDSVTLAVPALRARSAKATIFPVVRTTCGGDPLWWDDMTDMVRLGHVNGKGFAPLLSDIDGCEPFPDDGYDDLRGNSRSAWAEYLCQRLLEVPGARRQSALNVLRSRLSVSSSRTPAARRYATWDELRSTAAAGFEIGGHTVDHLVLTCEDPNLARAQIADCRTVLEREIGQPVRSFAYPNGRHDATVRALTAAAGYRLAVTVQPGVNYTSTNPYELRRVPVHDERPFHLALKLAFYGWAKRG